MIGVAPRAVMAAHFLSLPAVAKTRAPKVRAMEIIESLEPTRRALYAGTVGYVDASGDMDMAIAIRTAVLHQGRAYVQAGAGVVADSDPSATVIDRSPSVSPAAGPVFITAAVRAKKMSAIQPCRMFRRARTPIMPARAMAPVQAITAKRSNWNVMAARDQARRNISATPKSTAPILRRILLPQSRVHDPQRRRKELTGRAQDKGACLGECPALSRLAAQCGIGGCQLDVPVMIEAAAGAHGGYVDQDHVALLRRGLEGATRTTHVEEIDGEFVAIDRALAQFPGARVEALLGALPPALRRRIEAANAQDMMLYDRAVALIEKDHRP